jgi:predicted RNase H-like HicB family nuclease
VIAMRNDVRYELMIYWSDEDRAFIAEVPELPGCVADGATYEKALENVKVIISEWLETAEELGRAIPQPRAHRKFA